MILVNLTCGRNPWKKASPEDSTFRAFLKDANFLSSILPISAEFNMILRRIFECNPQKRISLEELRDLIITCPRLTMSAYSEYPPSPVEQAYEYVDNMECATLALPPSPPITPPPPAGPSYHAQPSEWSLFDTSSKQASSGSSFSSDSGYESDPSYHEAACQQTPQSFNFYGNFLPFDLEKTMFQHYNMIRPTMATF